MKASSGANGWVKIANGLPEVLERKAIERDLSPLSDRAFRLYITAACWSSKALSDGVIPGERVKRLTPTSNKRAVDELLEAGLFDLTSKGDIVVHDYLQYNPSRADIKQRHEDTETRRQDAAERKRRQRERERETDTVTPNVTRDVTRDSDRDEARDPRARDRSVPYRNETGSTSEPEKSSEVGNNKKPRESELQRASEATLLVVKTLTSQILERDPNAKVAPESEPWIREARLLLERDKRPVEEVTAVLDWLPTHKGSNGFSWPAVILSVPKFREKFTDLFSAMTQSRQGSGSPLMHAGRHQPRAAPAATPCPDESHDLTERWDEISGQLRERVGDGMFDVWLAGGHVHRLEPVLELAFAPDKVGWIPERFGHAIEAAAGESVRIVACAGLEEARAA